MAPEHPQLLRLLLRAGEDPEQAVLAAHDQDARVEVDAILQANRGGDRRQCAPCTEMTTSAAW
jgi:hypothetical protein